MSTVLFAEIGTFLMYAMAIIIVASIFLLGFFLVLDRLVIALRLKRKENRREIIKRWRSAKKRRKEEYQRIKNAKPQQ